jgi:ferredoxin
MSSPNKGLVITLSDGSTFTSTQDTILEDLETHHIEMEYHCREGFCGACRCKLISGEVDYTVDPLAFIDDDEILPCVTKPLTDIKIDC